MTQNVIDNIIDLHKINEKFISLVIPPKININYYYSGIPTTFYNSCFKYHSFVLVVYYDESNEKFYIQINDKFIHYVSDIIVIEDSIDLDPSNTLIRILHHNSYKIYPDIKLKIIEKYNSYKDLSDGEIGNLDNISFLQMIITNIHKDFVKNFKDDAVTFEELSQEIKLHIVQINRQYIDIENNIIIPCLPYKYNVATYNMGFIKYNNIKKIVAIIIEHYTNKNILNNTWTDIINAIFFG